MSSSSGWQIVKQNKIMISCLPLLTFFPWLPITVSHGVALFLISFWFFGRICPYSQGTYLWSFWNLFWFFLSFFFFFTYSEKFTLCWGFESFLLKGIKSKVFLRAVLLLLRMFSCFLYPVCTSTAITILLPSLFFLLVSDAEDSVKLSFWCCHCYFPMLGIRMQNMSSYLGHKTCAMCSDHSSV